MTDSLRTRLSAIEPAMLRGISRGLEKESLRATADGNLSMRPHPRALGAPLTHPRITTDFSESQVELITGVHEDIEACLAELTETHQITLADIDGESLWCTSMPCPLPADDQIPIGQYGSSFVGRTKTIYRVGLKHRYGSRMQTISGLHYNFSIPQTLWPLLQQMPGLRLDENPKRARSQGYFGLIRNFRQHSWLLLLLFGVGTFIGNLVGGKLADRSLDRSLSIILVALVIVLTGFALGATFWWVVLVAMFLGLMKAFNMEELTILIGPARSLLRKFGIGK